MKTRDRAEAGDLDPTKTVQLDDNYLLLAGVGERASGHTRSANGVCLPSTRTSPLDDQWHDARSALDAALDEFKTASRAVIDRIKAGEYLPKPELDREWDARLQLTEARRSFARLDRLCNKLART